MDINVLIYYLAFAAIFLIVLFIVVFVVVLKNFDAKFNGYLTSTTEKSKIISNQLSLIHDSILILSTILRPSCVEMLNKYLSEPNNILLKDLYRCSQIHDDKCQGTKCCCTCKYQRVLYSLNSQEELKDIAILCSVGDIDVLSSDHGTCPLYDEREILKKV